MIVLLIVLPVLALTIVIVIAIVRRFSQSDRRPQPPPIPASNEARLLELADLRSKNLISEVEHDEKRRSILNRI